MLPLSGMEHQVKGTGWLHTRAITTFGFKRCDFFDVILRNPLAREQKPDRVKLCNLEPIERQIETDNAILEPTVDKIERLPDRLQPDII
jgi:hypothetical protein